MAQKEYDVGESSSLSGVCRKPEKMRGELNALRNLAREQFEKVYKEIECATGSNLLKKTRSGSELVGLGGILQEKHSESWVNVNKMLHCLKTTVDTVCKKVDDILLCPDISFCESRQDSVLAKVENVATQTICMSPREDFEKNLLEQNFHLCGIQNMNWLEKFNDIATLGTKLDAIQKSLSMPEAELISHGLCNLHHKAFGNHATPPTSLCGENGTVDASKSYEFQHVKHMTKEELVDYFNDIIIKIKRDHESDQNLKTDEYFRLKREYLKLKRSFFTRIKDEEFVALRKKFSVVISKLEDFLSENERFPALTTNLESMENMMHRLENLLSENRRLRDCLNDKENEVKCLKEQVSSSASEILQHSLAEQNLLKLVESLGSAMEDSCKEVSLNEEIYSSVMTEQIAQTQCSSEAAYPAETASKYGIEDSDIESLIMQGLNALVFMEIIRDAGQQLDDLHQKVLIDEEVKAFLERKSLEKESKLSLEIEEHEILKQEILEVRIAMELLRSQHLEALEQIDVANVLTRSEQILKQKLERKNINLKRAEYEVDLLGDQVDALLRLLEKIYIVLDHYSPVLKYYPGIIEILELVRRELTGESTMRS